MKTEAGGESDGDAREEGKKGEKEKKDSKKDEDESWTGENERASWHRARARRARQEIS